MSSFRSTSEPAQYLYKAAMNHNAVQTDFRDKCDRHVAECTYRGADKSLAGAGRNTLQRPNSNFCKPLKKNSESCPTNQISAAAMTSLSEEEWRPYSCFFQSSRATDLPRISTPVFDIRLDSLLRFLCCFTSVYLTVRLRWPVGLLSAGLRDHNFQKLVFLYILLYSLSTQSS